MSLTENFFAGAYLVATILFIFGLKGLASPRTALNGNRAAMAGMALAVLVTLLHPEVRSYHWIWGGLAIGAVIGIGLALKIHMTAMPQLVAALHSFVGLAAVLVAGGTYMAHASRNDHNPVLLLELALGSAIGAITFTGSVIAFAKLHELMGSNPITFKGQHLLNLLLGLATLALVGCFITTPTLGLFIGLSALALLLGILLIIPIGGADMPVVVSMLNSYSGWAASATGFTLNNNLLIATGALVGSSGAILSYIMCKAMNRSFFSVLLGGFGATPDDTQGATTQRKGIKSLGIEDAAYIIENSERVIIIPGYGMAVAQAQHALKDFYNLLCDKKLEVKFAIHPVAGRMPGHMNVLLAEADIPYDSVFEMDEINGEFPTTDVSLVIGANDVVNPAAKTDKKSPLYGMPILDAYKSRQVFVIKRSMKPGYSGVDNELFYYDNTSLVFGDAKAVIEGLTTSLRGGGH